MACTASSLTSKHCPAVRKLQQTGSQPTARRKAPGLVSAWNMKPMTDNERSGPVRGLSSNWDPV